MSPRRANQVINVEATDNPRKIVNFNYSKNFNRVIELKLKIIIDGKEIYFIY